MAFYYFKNSKDAGTDKIHIVEINEAAYEEAAKKIRNLPFGKFLPYVFYRFDSEKHEAVELNRQFDTIIRYHTFEAFQRVLDHHIFNKEN